MTLPGPGDPETWPAYTGHPNDPRGGGGEEDELVLARMEPEVRCEECDAHVPTRDLEIQVVDFQGWRQGPYGGWDASFTWECTECGETNLGHAGDESLPD